METPQWLSKEINVNERNKTPDQTQTPFDLLRQGQHTSGESSDSPSRAQRSERLPFPLDQDEKKRETITLKPQLHHETPLKSAILAEIGKQLSYEHLLTAQGQYFLSTNLGSQWLGS